MTLTTDHRAIQWWKDVWMFTSWVDLFHTCVGTSCDCCG